MRRRAPSGAVFVQAGGDDVGDDIETVERTSVTRRFALKGAGAASLAALATRGGPHTAAVQDATPPTSGDYPTIAFAAKDFEFVGLPASVEGGYTRLSMSQEGPSDHHAMFMRLNEGVTTDDLLAAAEAGDFGQIVGSAVSLGGPNGGGPGSVIDVIVDLTSGQYAVVCLIPDEESGMLHAAMGMFNELEVTEAVTAMDPPEINGAIDLVDFGFEGLPSELPVGRHIWAVSDTGEQLHELVIYKQAPGVPYSVIESIFLAPPAATPEASPVGTEATPEGAEENPEAQSSPEASGPPPFTAVGGVAPMFPGIINYLEVELDAGDYFAICFVPDPETGAPHFALGMLMPFTVA